jgi:hypothetical protein
MQAGLRYSLMTLLALLGAGVSDRIGGGDWMVVLGSFVGAASAAAAARIPWRLQAKTQENVAIAVCLLVLLILLLVPAATQLDAVAIPARYQVR